MHFVGRILKWIGLGLAALCVLGVLYQQIGTASDARLRPPVSQMVAVHGFAIHFACVGHGSRTYLLDSGAGVGGFEWGRLVPLLARTGRACVFDRPGLGWSDDTGEPHDVAALADQISEITKAADIARPFVYVGHSLGANDAIVFAVKFPRDVAALVLIEPGRPQDLLEDFHGSRADAMNVTECGISCVAAQTAVWLGVVRAGVRISGAGSHSLTPAMRSEYLAELSRPAEIRTIVATLEALPKSGYETADVKNFGHTPVLVLTSSDPRTRERDETVASFKQWRLDQLAYFGSLAKMSPCGRGPVVIANSTHATMVMSERGAAATAQSIATFLQDCTVD